MYAIGLGLLRHRYQMRPPLMLMKEGMLRAQDVAEKITLRVFTLISLGDQKRGSTMKPWFDAANDARIRAASALRVAYQTVNGMLRTP